jgi:hypothetical protein
MTVLSGPKRILFRFIRFIWNKKGLIHEKCFETTHAFLVHIFKINNCFSIINKITIEDIKSMMNPPHNKRPRVFYYDRLNFLKFSPISAGESTKLLWSDPSRRSSTMRRGLYIISTSHMIRFIPNVRRSPPCPQWWLQGQYYALPSLIC